MNQQEPDKKLEGQLSAEGEKRLWKNYYDYFDGEKEAQRIPNDPIRWIKAQFGAHGVFDTIEENEPIDPAKGYLKFVFRDRDQANAFLKRFRY